MVINNVDRVPANSNVFIFRLFKFFKGFTASLETAIHIIADTKATMAITLLDIFETSFMIALF